MKPPERNTPSPQPVVVAPSILSANFARLAEALHQLENAGADWIHVDVMDGHFVPNLTIGPPVIEALAKETTLPLDVHLMIETPERWLQDYAQAGARVITVHQEACTHLHRTLTHIRELGCLAGVSLNPATPVSLLEEVLGEVDLILIMSVNPGFGGQRFIPNSLKRLRQVRTLLNEAGLGGSVRLEVDGGIGPSTISEVLAAGADTIVAGNAVFKAPCMKEAIATLKGRL
jgi:ribulose-phosphate 3-epimerase